RRRGICPRRCGRDCIRVRVKHASHAAEAVLGEEEKEPVSENGSAYRSAKLMLLMNRLRQQKRSRAVMQRLELAIGIECVQRGITQIVEGIAVELIGAAAGNRVHL